MIRVVDLLLAAEAHTVCGDVKAATERHRRLRGKYLANAQLRQAVNATAALVIGRLQQLRDGTIDDILRRQADLLAAPESADENELIWRENKNRFASDSKTRLSGGNVINVGTPTTDQFHAQLLRDYDRDPAYRSYIDKLADVVVEGSTVPVQ